MYARPCACSIIRTRAKVGWTRFARRRQSDSYERTLRSGKRSILIPPLCSTWLSLVAWPILFPTLQSSHASSFGRVLNPYFFVFFVPRNGTGSIHSRVQRTRKGYRGKFEMGKEVSACMPGVFRKRLPARLLSRATTWSSNRFVNRMKVWGEFDQR